MISVIICSRNRPALVMDALRSVLGGTLLPAEVVVVDQSDTEHPEIPSFRGNGVRIVYVRQAGRGVSRARNAGASTASGDILAFIDDDVLLTPNWLYNLVSALQESGSGSVVTGNVRGQDAEIEGGFAPSVSGSDTPVIYRSRGSVDVLFTGNMAIHRKNLLETGGFDERLGPGTRFPAAEDNDLAMRLLLRGHAIVYEPSAVVFHRAWRPAADYLPLRWKYGRGQGGFYAKHLSRRDEYAFTRLRDDVVRYARRLARFVHMDRRKALGDLLYILGILIGVGEWLIRHGRATASPAGSPAAPLSTWWAR